MNVYEVSMRNRMVEQLCQSVAESMRMFDVVWSISQTEVHPTVLAVVVKVTNSSVSQANGDNLWKLQQKQILETLKSDCGIVCNSFNPKNPTIHVWNSRVTIQSDTDGGHSVVYRVSIHRSKDAV